MSTVLRPEYPLQHAVRAFVAMTANVVRNYKTLVDSQMVLGHCFPFTEYRPVP